MAVNLFWKASGEGLPVVLLHGLFGSGGNLGGLARALAQRYRVFLVDLPNHGRSDWVASMDLTAMADLMSQWLDSQGLARAAFVGHSLGGKLAMQLALARPECVTALVAADIAPVAYPPHHDGVFAALAAVSAGACRSREEAAALMTEHIDEQQVLQFLLMSLRREQDGIYRWRFNEVGIRDDYGSVQEPPAGATPFDGPVLFVKGGASEYIQERHRQAILERFPAAQVKVMPGCGHWLHAEQPRLFNGIVGRFLDGALGG